LKIFLAYAYVNHLLKSEFHEIHRQGDQYYFYRRNEADTRRLTTNENETH